jgi:Xaa-Pro aminopeptidase
MAIPLIQKETASQKLEVGLARRGLDGFVVPHADRHQNEYLAPSEERLAWLTGFTGSAGAAVILADRAANQVDAALFSTEHIVDAPPSAWIELTAGQKLGYDAWLHSAKSAERLAKAFAAVGAVLVAIQSGRQHTKLNGSGIVQSVEYN